MSAKNFSHPIKATKVQAMSIDSVTSLHKVGCAHIKKAEWVCSVIDDSAELVEKTLTVYRDDFYLVAPCARKA